MKIPQNRGVLFLLLVFACVFFIACGESVEDEEPASTTDDIVNSGPVTAPETYSSRSYEDSVIRVKFTGSTAKVDLQNLQSHDIFLVKVNTGVDVATGEATGGASGYSKLSRGNTLRQDVVNKTAADVFCGLGNDLGMPKIPPILPHAKSRDRLVKFVAPKVGDVRGFWVDGSNKQKTATLRASGKYCNIWVINDAYTDVDSVLGLRKINTATAEQMAKNFDEIYPLETSAFGYEQGGGPNGDGGVDGDPKVQVLVIENLSTLAFAGLFQAWDLYTQEYAGLTATNEAEIFYVSASAAAGGHPINTEVMIHEFMHLIQFSQHFLGGDSWYKEMLAVLAVDIIGSYVGISSSSPLHPIRRYVPMFLANYANEGIAQLSAKSNEVYSVKYSFGAYLARNYGGLTLLEKLVKSPLPDGVSSIDTALGEISPGLTFKQALSRYGEALVFSGTHKPKGVVSFDRSVAQNLGGTRYLLEGYDIWEKNCLGGIDGKGPIIYDLVPTEMQPFSLIVQSSDDWLRKTGNYSITLQKPTNPDVELYLMVR